MHVKGKIIFTVVEEGSTSPPDAPDFEVVAPGVEGYIIGRSDTATDYEPDIDLALHGAQQSGISRRHAALVCQDNQLHIVDLGSMNGTFVNGKQISPQIANVINNGDQLSFGNLNVVVSQSI